MTADSNLNLSTDELLTTTRSVRKRLDFDKPVPREVIMECLNLALQAPTGSNAQGWQWVFVTDPAKKKALADIYRSNANPYLDLPAPERGDIRDEQIGAVMSSAKFLNENFEQAGVVLGVAAARGMELHAGVALAGPGFGVDDAAPAGRR